MPIVSTIPYRLWSLDITYNVHTKCLCVCVTLLQRYRTHVISCMSIWVSVDTYSTMLHVIFIWYKVNQLPKKCPVYSPYVEDQKYFLFHNTILPWFIWRALFYLIVKIVFVKCDTKKWCFQTLEFTVKPIELLVELGALYKHSGFSHTPRILRLLPHQKRWSNEYA